jgi:hypothetical protein
VPPAPAVLSGLTPRARSSGRGSARGQLRPAAAAEGAPLALAVAGPQYLASKRSGQSAAAAPARAATCQAAPSPQRLERAAAGSGLSASAAHPSPRPAPRPQQLEGSGRATAAASSAAPLAGVTGVGMPPAPAIDLQASTQPAAVPAVPPAPALHPHQASEAFQPAWGGSTALQRAQEAARPSHHPQRPGQPRLPLLEPSGPTASPAVGIVASPRLQPQSRPHTASSPAPSPQTAWGADEALAAEGVPADLRWAPICAGADARAAGESLRPRAGFVGGPGGSRPSSDAGRMGGAGAEPAASVPVPRFGGLPAAAVPAAGLAQGRSLNARPSSALVPWSDTVERDPSPDAGLQEPQRRASQLGRESPALRVPAVAEGLAAL